MPTVNGLALSVVQGRVQRAGPDEIARLLSGLDVLPNPPDPPGGSA